MKTNVETKYPYIRKSVYLLILYFMYMNNIFFRRRWWDKENRLFSKNYSLLSNNINAFLKTLLLFFLLFISFTNYAQKKVSINSFQIIQASDTISDISSKDAKGNFSITVSSTNVTCAGLCNGTITIEINGAPTFPVQVRVTKPPDLGGGFLIYNNLQASDFPFTITDLCGSASPYQIRVRDTDGSFVTASVYILNPNEMDIYEEDVEIINESCAGKCDGSIIIYNVEFAIYPVTYSWSSGENNDTIQNKCAGIYTVTVTDDNACTKSFTFDITAPPVLTFDSLVYTPVFCNGSTGSITAYFSGGVAPYDYDIGTGYQGSNTFNNLAAGTYTVTVQDGNGCPAVSNPATLTENSAIVLSETHTDVTCAGLATGSINLIVSGGTAPYTFSWNGPSCPCTTEDISNLLAGVYNVTVTDNYGCTSTLSVTINSPDSISITETHTNVSCFNGSDGSIQLTVSGGTLPYSYTWTGPSCPCPNSPNLSNIKAGTYSVTVTDAAFCTSTLTIIITQPPPMNIVGNITNVLCYGQCTGKIDLTVTGATPPYIYTWTGPSCPCSGPNLTNLCAGIYWVTITDFNGCTQVRSFQITSPPDITINYFSQNPTCNGYCDGIINLNVNGGTPPMTYTWDHGLPPQPNQPNLCAGTYNVTVKDANNCPKTETITLIDPPGMILSETHVNVTCNGLCTGSIDLTVAGAVNPITYAWTGPNGFSSNQQNISNLCAGNYTVTVTDGSTCSKTLNVTITENAAMIITANIVNVTCYGGNDGSININVSGGTAPYSYQWSTGANNTTLVGLTAGIYYLTITDNLGCIKDTFFTVTEPDAISITETHQNVSCFGLADGWIDIVVSNGVSPYSYVWSGPSCPCNGTHITNLQAGTYFVTVTDANSCKKILSIQITEPSVLKAPITSQTNMQCGGSCNGSATVSPTGGTPTYSYLWNNGENTPIADSLCAGWNYITVSDANGCTAIDSTEILAPPALTASITDSVMSCGSFPTVVAGTTFIPDGDGTIYTTSITQTDFPSGASINNSSDITSICLNMEHSWLGDLEIKIICPNGQSSILKQDSHIPGFEEFLGIPNESDGIDPYDPAQNPPGTGWDYCFSNTPMYGTMVNESNNYHTLPAGSYTPYESFTNLIGCPIYGDWTISVIDNWGYDNGYIFSWLINFDPSTYPYQFCNGSATVTPQGGTSPYTYYWSNGTTTQVDSNLCSGTYCVTVTDANNCTATDCVTITDIDLNIDSISKINASCSGVCNGSATVYSSGGFAPITYIWSNGGITQTISNLCAGTYKVTVTEANGCIAIDSVVITNNLNLQVTINTTGTIQCNGDCTGGAVVLVLNGTAPYTYNWSPNITDVTPIISGKCADTYFVTVTDADGCSTTSSVTFIEPPALSIDSVISANIQPCNGDNNGSVCIYLHGGTPPYQYNIGSGNQANNCFTGLSAATYTPTITDANGCTLVGNSVTITEPTVLVINSVTTTDVTPCHGSANGSILVNVSGGVPAYQYNIGSGNQPSNLFNGLSGGNYTITITDALGCTIVTNPIIINEPPVLTADYVSSTDVACNGGNTGTLVITGNGGIAPYSYNWTGPACPCSGPSLSNLTAGLYYVTVTDYLGCTATNVFEIKDTSNLSLTLVSKHDPTCYGTCNGDITVTTSGGYPPYTYIWNPVLPSQPNQTNLCAGTYDVTVYDDSLCSRALSIQLNNPPILGDSITLVNPIVCNGVCNATVTVHAFGGTGTYTYLWNNSVTTPINSNLCAGTFYVTITDGNGCTKTDSITITQPAPIVNTLTITQSISCFEKCDGTVQIATVGGTPPYGYTWSNGNSGNTASNVCSGWLYVTTTDANSCPKVDSINITQPDSIQITFINVTHVNCHGDCSGQATAQVSGGTNPYTYQWDATANNQTTATADSLCGGFHFITVTDNNGCSNSTSVNITDTSNLTLNIILQQNPSCFGYCDGAITVAASGGHLPYDYLWDDGSFNPARINLCADTFYVTVTDDSLCMNALQIILTNPPVLDDSITIDQAITCNDTCNGMVTVHAFGGNGTYTYLWDDAGNSTTASISNLCAGTYHVTVTVGGTCTTTDSVIVSEPTAILSTLSITQPISCYGNCNGAVQVFPSGGTPPYTYLWDDGSVTTISTNLCAGWIYVTISDVNLCQKVDSIELTQPDSLKLMMSSTPVACSGNCTGIATVLVMGGTPTYSYLWDANASNQTTPVADSLCLGTYYVTVTDSHGCFKIDSIAVSDTSHLSISIVLLQNPSCSGLCDGKITVVGTGGYSPYTYLWNTGNINPGISGLCADTFYVTVTDDSLCKRSTSITLNNPPLVDDTVIVLHDISCNSSCDGSVYVIPSGGNGAPYTYQWDDPLLSQTDTINYLCQGLYHVTISDVNNCSTIDSVLLTEPPALTINVTNVQNITCNGSCNGTASASISGGSPPYHYIWSNGDTTNVADSLCAGWVYITVTDENYCQIIDSIQILQPDPIQLTFTNIIPSICGPSTCVGSATVVATGGTGIYTYQWDANAHNQTTNTADSLCVNIYNVTVTDTNGCTSVGSVTIIDTSNLSLTITHIHQISCEGDCDGSATATVTGGFPPYTFLWNTVPPQTDSTAINLCAGTYTVTVVDDSLCSRIDTVNINNANVFAVQDSIIPISCSGLCNATIILIPTGGTPPYISYVWSIPGETDSIASGLCPGTYYYTVTDSNNCVVSDSVTIVDPGLMTVTVNVLHPILCYGDCNGSLGLTITGSLGPYIYNWSNGLTDSVLTDLCAGTYDVTVTGQGNCIATSSYTLVAPDSLQINFTNILHVACGGDSSGRVTAVVNGGTPPYQYQWDANADSATTPTIDSLSANLYNITVTDQHGCTLTSSFEITDTSHLLLQIIDSSMVTCFGLCNGSATAQAQNGIPPYNYIWNTVPSQNTSQADSLCAGTYRITVTDDSLCSRVKPITITQPDSLYLSIKDSSLIQCFGDCTGSITLSPNGGTQPYIIQWSNGGADSTVSALCTGLYSATLTDAHNCIDSMRYFVGQPTALSDSSSIITALCSTGTNDGSVTITLSGGTMPYQIVWNTGDSLLHLDSLSSGTYYYTITDAHGCKKQDSVSVHSTIIVHATAKSDTTICYGDSVQIYGFGGSVYFWTPGTGLSDSTVFNPFAKPTQTTTYYFTVYDSICFAVDSVTIGVYSPFTVDAGINQSILYDHSTLLSGICSDPSATFLWMPFTGLEDSSSLATNAHPLQTTTYYLYATNANGCEVIDSVTITVIPKIRVPSGITPNGDGINDTWVIDMIELFPNCEVMIFNRWGEKLFYSKGYPTSERWDGTYKGKPLPVGTYYYIIVLHDEAYPDPITGPITIMR